MIVARQEIIVQLLIIKEKPEIVVQFVLSAYIFSCYRGCFLLHLVSFNFPKLSTTFTPTPQGLYSIQNPNSPPKKKSTKMLS